MLQQTHTLAAGAGFSDGVIRDLIVILASAAGVLMVLGRLRLAAIAGYLITGAILGPSLLGVIDDSDRIDTISGVAIVLLMFGIGMHMDLSDLRSGMVPRILLGVLSTLLSAIVFTPIMLLYDMALPKAIALGLALSMSSTAVVLRVLQQRREMHRLRGRLAFATLLMQDLLAVVFIAVMPALAAWEKGGGGQVSESSVMSLVGRGAMGVGGVLLLLLFGRLVLPRLLHESAKHAGGEVTLVLAAAVGLGAAAMTSALGFSPELGAFLAGFLLASTEFKHQLTGQLTPMRDLFMAVFFTSIGLELNLGLLGSNWWMAMLAVALIIIVKFCVISTTAWAVGTPSPTAAMTGMTLAHGGEFTLVVLAAANAGGLVDDQAGASVVTAIILTLIFTPTMIAIAPKFGTLFARVPTAPWVGANSPLMNDKHDGSTSHSRRHVIIAGYGLVGRAVVERLIADGIEVIIVELNPATVRKQRSLGRAAMYGDVSNPEVLESARLHEAEAVVITIPDDDAMLRAVRAIREADKRVFIASRTAFLSKALLARDLGADHVVVEEIATAEAMDAQLLTKLKQRRARDAAERADAAKNAGAQPSD